ncbi:MAG: ABC transporter substrate-binding protein [Propionibacteriaceae bacterium]|jgi:polar amino acid transport system substrate-binding protein|nr:ABC transporter substrate-binding protein [Propionibacteriaceae bacterium]
MTRIRGGTRFAAILAGLSCLLTLTACAPAPVTSPSASASGKPTGHNLATVTPGKLTIATGDPAYAPWVIADDPASGKGFEPAVSYAVAKKLGFAAADVVWVRTSFDAAIAPGPKNWDLNIQQLSVTAERKQAVDFSSPYYTTTQAILARAGSPAIGAKSVADLADVQFGAPVGTTSLTALVNIVKPNNDPKVFNNLEDATEALRNRQVEAIIADLPQALYICSAEVKGSVVVGQLDSKAGGDSFAYVLPKGSPLTAVVSAALDELRADKTLAKITAEWLSDSISVPVLK